MPAGNTWVQFGVDQVNLLVCGMPWIAINYIWIWCLKNGVDSVGKQLPPLPLSTKNRNKTILVLYIEFLVNVLVTSLCLDYSGCHKMCCLHSYATYSCNNQLVYAAFTAGNIGVFIWCWQPETKMLQCRIASSAYLHQTSPNSSLNVYFICISTWFLLLTSPLLEMTIYLLMLEAMFIKTRPNWLVELWIGYKLCFWMCA